MKQLVSTVTSKGQTTIPVEVRRHLGINQGDKVIFEIDEQGDVHVKPTPYSNVASLRGVAGKLPRPMSWHEMRDTAYEDRWIAKGETSS